MSSERQWSRRMKRVVCRSGRCGLLLLSLGTLSACVTVPESLRGTSEAPQMDLVRVMSAPAVYVGQESRLGGKVVAVSNEANRTRLEISSMPLDAGARPVLGAPSEGRFVAYVNDFLEPTDYTNQLVTVVGPITGSEQGKIGNRPYRFVVVQADRYKRWRVVQQLAPSAGMYDPWWGYRGRPGWGPRWGWDEWPGPARLEMLVTE
ncbi:hypothetical protein AU490_01595 [Lonsdalea populi]|nr:hypothetical protein AU486_08000 [Lonsdalea quercina]RAT31136.1 hypothetical protein AU490_01595 [Lonsdalea populi]RAT36064.1 hypothetical protein AU491_07070 [Lonsdalea populi]RAT48006.1 hypothetical protein AU496_05780 [Lonsdalea populi]RAT55636.1 hypothetical protein AU498_02175 [Lonsdalea populi]